jgi:protoporphyrinogen/coproporphyrinogen III oxidase
VYAGDPEKLSLRAAFPSLDEWERRYGSVLRGASKSRRAKGAGNGPPPLCSFDRGMAMLTSQLAAKLGERVRTGARANAVGKGEGNGSQYRIQFTHNGHAEALDASAVILAAPAYTAGKLVSSISEPLARTLSGIEYTGVAVIGAAYHAKQIGTTLDGFGLLVPRIERIRTLGIVWNSALFPDRSGQGRVLLTSFVGGATDTAILEMPDTEILAAVASESAKVLQIIGEPILSRLWRHPKALPQYNLGHGHIVEAIRSAERVIPGLYFAGNYLEGPSIGKCIARGTQTAEAALEYLRASTAQSA